MVILKPKHHIFDITKKHKIYDVPCNRIMKKHCYYWCKREIYEYFHAFLSCRINLQCLEQLMYSLFIMVYDHYHHKEFTENQSLDIISHNLIVRKPKSYFGSFNLMLVVSHFSVSVLYSSTLS